MAGLTRALRIAALALTLALAGGVAAAPAARADDPSSPPVSTDARQTCVERYPADGPAGVDLRLGCVVSELVGLYTAGQPTDPPTMSTYAVTVIGAGIVIGFAVWLGMRRLGRRAGERFAPVLAGGWWVCSSCRSVNGSGVRHCYSCGSPPPDGPTLPTDDRPQTPQSFGSTRKRG